MSTAVVPTSSYGILRRDVSASVADEAAEQVRRLGYARLDAGYTAAELAAISEAFETARERYVDRWTEVRLRSLDELNTLRALCTHGGPEFVKLAANPVLLDVLQRLIAGRFVLNQQNGIINPPAQPYNQGAWHRDLPYQHFVSSSALAINALFCVDDFTADNGATFVLPASQHAAAFPSESFVRDNAVQVEARAGEFILLDCMAFHAGGFNGTDRPRRAVNHVYTIPMFKQQIKIPGNIDAQRLSPQEKSLFGFDYQEPESVESYLESRAR
jgi:ectoine hydroxylase-related dioxygenase (phytanoyl-CoA dioxygenase family)